MGLLLCIQTILLLFFWHHCFGHPKWNGNWMAKSFLFLAPFLLGCIFVWVDLHLLPTEQLRIWHDELCCFSTITALLLLPQWYKLMWRLLISLPVHEISEDIRLIITAVFSCVMIIAVIFFFALYYLWIDSMNGYTHGLRSVFMHYQPVLLDFPTAFFFSFSCYFSLGLAYYPYGSWFYFLIFLECLIALLNNGIVLVYAYQFLFGKRKS